MSTISRCPPVRILFALGLTLISLTGCIRRTMTITTAPEGAVVRLNDREIGSTPVSVDFTWYGDYAIEITKPGYEPLRTHQKIEAPWYQLPGIDLFTEAFWPGTFHDKRDLYFELKPPTQVNREELIDQAKQFRERALFGEN